MAFRLSFFNSPNPRVFTYRPLFFDLEKEKWEQRRTQMSANELSKEPLFMATPGSHIRGSFQRALFESRRRSRENKYVRIIVLLSILILFFAAIYLANGLGFLFKSL